MGPYEAYARRYGHLHPEARQVLQPFFAPLRWDVNRVQIRFVPAWFFNIGPSSIVTAVAVFRRALYCIPGVLDADGPVRGEWWSWQQPRGIAHWGHQVFHCYQYERDGFWRHYGRFALGILASLAQGKAYDAALIPQAQEAYEFEAQILIVLRQQTVQEGGTHGPL